MVRVERMRGVVTLDGTFASGAQRKGWSCKKGRFESKFFEKFQKVSRFWQARKKNSEKGPLRRRGFRLSPFSNHLVRDACRRSSHVPDNSPLGWTAARPALDSNSSAGSYHGNTVSAGKIVQNEAANRTVWFSRTSIISTAKKRAAALLSL